MDANHPEELFAEDERVEITDLPGQTQPARQARQRPTRRSVRVPKNRWLRLAALLAVSIASLALLLQATPDLQRPLLNVFFGPAPTNGTTGVGIDQIYISPGPGWARLAIDGKPIARTPLINQGPSVHLAPGTHHLRWQAAPFYTQSCTLSVPWQDADTCSVSETTSTPNRERAWIVQFNASWQTLGNNERDTLIPALFQALSRFQASDLVYPGEHFVNKSPLYGGSVATAHQALTATFSLLLNTISGNESLCSGGSGANVGSCQLASQDCHLFCTLASSLPTTWNIVALVQSAWRYNTPQGTTLAANLPDGSGGAAYFQHFLPLSVSWDGTNWHAEAGQEFLNGSNFMPIPCASAADILSSNLYNTFGSSPWQSFEWRYLAADNPAAGCLLILTAISINNSSSTTSAQIIYLHRFGVSLAVNRLAQEYDPEMPRPDAHEMDLARQIARQAHVSLA